MSEVDISEGLPNDDDPAFTEHHHHHHQQQQQQEPSEPAGVEGEADGSGGAVRQAAGSGTIPPDQVFVATSQGLLTAEQLHEAGIKTTHIVIHDQTLTVAAESGASASAAGLKSPASPLPPPTPATPLSKEKGFKYQWDESVQSPYLPVRCKNTNGELHKNKFGSGGRGKCIKNGNLWYTPNEFESISGRASSKDWKRSIRYGGRTLQCLIEDGILQPHATSCTCAACCDDESVTGPVRLFVPYKRRKRDSESGPPSPLSKKVRPGAAKSPTVVPSLPKEVVVSIASSGALGRPITVSSAENGETVHIVSADASGNLITPGDAVVMTALGNGTKTTSATVLTMDVSEQKHWWQLEEMANSLLQQAQQLKGMIEHAKHHSLVTKETAIQQVKLQLEKEKQDALNAARIEAQMNLSRAVMEERAQKDIAVQHALAQARAEMQEKMDSVTVVSDDKVTYTVAWTHQATQSNIDSMMDGEVGDELDKKD